MLRKYSAKPLNSLSLLLREQNTLKWEVTLVVGNSKIGVHPGLQLRLPRGEAVSLPEVKLLRNQRTLTRMRVNL